jgi:pantothenate kinase
MSGIRELTLKVPAELADNFSGLALDLGGTQKKFAYRSKDDREVANGHATTNLSVLHLVSFDNQLVALDVALEFVRQRADLRRDSAEKDGIVTVRTTGGGGHAFRDDIIKTLHVDLENLGEFDCFARSFYYLARRLPRSELLEPFQKDAITDPMKEAESMNTAYKGGIEAKQTDAVGVGNRLYNEVVRRLLERSSRDATDAAVDIPLAEAEPDVFPCLLVYVGSGTGFLLINKDGTFQLVEFLNRTGKSYFGIGKMLTGCQTFDELIDLASKGNRRNVDQYTDVYSKVDVSDFYSALIPPTPYLLYGFGKAADSDPGKLSREDVAHSWLSHVSAELARSIQLVCYLHGIKRVFFCGRFCSRPLVRQIITAEFAHRLLIQQTYVEVDDYIDLDFIKGGEFIGVLGCVVTDLLTKQK